jgi:hypothetical protein
VAIKKAAASVSALVAFSPRTAALLAARRWTELEVGLRRRPFDLSLFKGHANLFGGN